jgi:hypothetical protein
VAGGARARRRGPARGRRPPGRAGRHRRRGRPGPGPSRGPGRGRVQHAVGAQVRPGPDHPGVPLPGYPVGRAARRPWPRARPGTRTAPWPG